MPGVPLPASQPRSKPITLLFFDYTWDCFVAGIETLAPNGLMLTSATPSQGPVGAFLYRDTLRGVTRRERARWRAPVCHPPSLRFFLAKKVSALGGIPRAEEAATRRLHGSRSTRNIPVGGGRAHRTFRRCGADQMESARLTMPTLPAILRSTTPAEGVTLAINFGPMLSRKPL